MVLTGFVTSSGYVILLKAVPGPLPSCCNCVTAGIQAQGSLTGLPSLQFEKACWCVRDSSPHPNPGDGDSAPAGDGPEDTARLGPQRWRASCQQPAVWSLLTSGLVPRRPGSLGRDRVLVRAHVEGCTVPVGTLTRAHAFLSPPLSHCPSHQGCLLQLPTLRTEQLQGAPVTWPAR